MIIEHYIVGRVEAIAKPDFLWYPVQINAKYVFDIWQVSQTQPTTGKSIMTICQLDTV